MVVDHANHSSILPVGIVPCLFLNAFFQTSMKPVASGSATAATSHCSSVTSHCLQRRPGIGQGHEVLDDDEVDIAVRHHLCLADLRHIRRAVAAFNIHLKHARPR